MHFLKVNFGFALIEVCHVFQLDSRGTNGVYTIFTLFTNLPYSPDASSEPSDTQEISATDHPVPWLSP